jgi:hypothetical protein
MFDFGKDTVSASKLAESPLHTADTNFEDTTWNQTTKATGAQSVIDSKGNTTEVSIYVGRAATSTTWTSINFGAAANDLANNSTGVFSGNSVGSDGIRGSHASPTQIEGDGAVGIAITGLAAGTYDLYIVGIDRSSASPAMKFWAAEGTLSNLSQPLTHASNSFDAAMLIANGAQATSSNTVADTWTENGNYVKLSVTLTGTANTYLTIFALGANPDDTRGILNSLQVVSQIPEPATVAGITGLLLFAGTVIARRHARR